jgi:hypothetical protein
MIYFIITHTQIGLRDRYESAWCARSCLAWLLSLQTAPAALPTGAAHYCGRDDSAAVQRSRLTLRLRRLLSHMKIRTLFLWLLLVAATAAAEIEKVAPVAHEKMTTCTGKCAGNCKVYEPPVGRCYSPPKLWPRDPQWGVSDTWDVCNGSHLQRSFFSSVDSTCRGRTGGFTLPLRTCVGPFGKPRPWGNFSCDGHFVRRPGT